MAKGPRVRGKAAVRRVPLSLKVPPEVRAILEKAADRSGRSLAAEVEFRVHKYETLHGFVDRLLNDSVAINVAVGLGTLRKAVETTDDGIEDDEEISLERAIKTAACISELFKVVADHAGQALAEKKATMLAEDLMQRVEAGNLKHDFDIQAVAAQLSEGLVALMMEVGRSMVFDIGATIGPDIWGVCFDKDDPLRSPPPRGLGRLSRNLPDSSVDLPLRFMPPLPTKEERKASIDALKKIPELRATVKRRMSEGQYSGMSEKEAIDMLYDELHKPFGMDPDEAVPDVATG